MKNLRRGGIVSGVIGAMGNKLKFSKPSKKLPCMTKPARAASHPDGDVKVLEIIEPKAPRSPLTEDQLTNAFQDAYKRHLKRAADDKPTALDMTYHFLKHMGYDDLEWEFLVKIMMVVKGEIDG